MKVGKKALRMSSGEVRHFGSEKKRDNFEHVAAAYSHGWKGPKHPNAGSFPSKYKGGK
jgi:hypothetical protein